MSWSDETQGKRRIGYLTADLGVPFERELLGHALRVASRLGIEVVATCGGSLGPRKSSDAFAYGTLREARLDGILLCAHTVCVGMTAAQIAEFAKSFAPAQVVMVGAEVPGFRCHTVSNELGASALAEHLIQTHGRRHFAVVRGPMGHSEADARQRGIERALQRHDLPLTKEHILQGDFTHQSGAQAAEQLLVVDPRLSNTDAIVFANDLMAIAALDVFARERISIPAAVSVAGFDDIELAHLARNPLTTVRQPLSKQITAALEDLVGALHGSVAPTLVEHRTRLVLRRSCGCGLVTTERISTTPPPPTPGSDPMQLMSEYGTAVASELNLTLADSSLPRALTDEWASNLVNTFVSRIREQDQTFMERIDASANALIQHDEPLTPLREAVLFLRRQLVVLTGPSGQAAEDLDDATAEALLTIGSVEALREAQRRRAFEAVAVDLASASAALSSAGSIAELRGVAYTELERLKIRTCVPLLLEGAPGEQPVHVPFSCVNGQRDAKLDHVEGDQLVLGPGIVEHLLLVPMAAQGAPLGYVLYDADPGSFLLSTRLTLALGAALRSAILKERLETAYEHIAQQALKDSLTGLWNRRYLDERLHEEVARCERSKDSLSACVVDLDGFKQVNDRHGHEAGDHVLILVAKLLTEATRTCDVVTRLGGDEFVVLFPNSDRCEALAAAARVVKYLDKKDKFGLITASVGVATTTAPPRGTEIGMELLRAADAALLAAKRRGKCQAVHADDVSGESS